MPPASTEVQPLSDEIPRPAASPPPVFPFTRIEVTPRRRMAAFVAGDALLVFAAFWLALFLRTEGAVSTRMLPGAFALSALAVVATLGFFQLAGVYRMSWRFFGLRDIFATAICVGYATALLLAVHTIALGSTLVAGLPRSTVLIHAPLAFLFVSAFRLSRRLVHLPGQGEHTVPTLLVGAGDTGEQVVRSILETPARERYAPVGFVDDDPLRQGTTIHGVPVLGPTSRLPALVRKHKVGALILALEGAGGAEVRALLETAREAGVREVRTVPPLGLAGGPASLATTREVGLDDLLGRNPIRLDLDEVRRFLRGKRVLVTGGAGTIGAELCRQVAQFSPATLAVLDTDESRLHDIALELREAQPGADVRELLLDIRDADRLSEAFAELRPDVVLHAAAYKHVPMMERWPVEGLAVNVLGTANVLAAAERWGSKQFVLISTDKAVDPCNVMGATKRLAEMLVTGAPASPTARTAVRFGNVLGSRGSVIPIFERQLRRGGPITVTHPEVERYFMTTGEAVSLVLQAAAMGGKGEVLFLDVGRPVRILDMAREFVRLHGLRPDVDVPIVFTGLRPGERLTEKFTHATEHLEATGHPQILAVPGSRQLLPLDALDRVRKVVASGDQPEARAFLRAMFPEVPAAPTEPSPAISHRT